MSLVLKIVGNEWNNASRDKRELSVYKELGYEVLVMAKGSPSDKGREEYVDGFRVLRYSTRPLGDRAPNALNRFFSLFQWVHYARMIHPDVISGHDLMPGLTIAWLSTLFQKKKPGLIYDAHEFEIGRNTDSRRSKLTTWLLMKEEKFLIKRCAFSIMVNDSIANEVQKIYRLKQRPVVVRSTPNYWEIDEEECRRKKILFLEQFQADGENVGFILMYHGGIIKNRGIEQILEAVENIKNVGVVILGNGNNTYINSLKQIASYRGIEKRIIFHEAVPISDLSKYVGAADLSLAPIELVAKNHYFSLPNKFFESIQAMTPIIASDMPEMRKIIEQYQIGLTCIPGNAQDLGEKIKRMINDKDFYKTCKENLIEAKKQLCWEKEKEVLIEAVRTYL